MALIAMMAVPATLSADSMPGNRRNDNRREHVGNSSRQKCKTNRRHSGRCTNECWTTDARYRGNRGSRGRQTSTRRATKVERTVVHRTTVVASTRSGGNHRYRSSGHGYSRPYRDHNRRDVVLIPFDRYYDDGSYGIGRQCIEYGYHELVPVLASVRIIPGSGVRCRMRCVYEDCGYRTTAHRRDPVRRIIDGVRSVLRN